MCILSLTIKQFGVVIIIRYLSLLLFLILAQPISSEVDVSALQRSRASIDKLRDELKLKDREINSKLAEIESVCLKN